MADRVLTLRDLNRATLARQFLLERSVLSTPAVIQRLIGLQAQQALPPYVGLWTRLPDFQRGDLAQLIEQRTVLKVTLMRATLHLVTADDYLRLRATLQPALTMARDTISKGRTGGEPDRDTLLSIARDYIAETPRTFAEISDMLAKALPDYDIGLLRYTVRMCLPLVQVPTETEWSYPGNPKFTLAETWLGQPVPTEENVRELVLRYLAAFGPATAADMQTWSALSKLKDMFDALKPELVVYRDEKKRELFDVPDAPVPGGDAPAPVRFLPEFDNLLLSHTKRTRVIADEYRKRVYLPGLRVAATFLVDGFVSGTWKTETKKGTATLTIQPFAALTSQDRQSLTDEAERLVRFIAGNAKAYEVRFGE